MTKADDRFEFLFVCHANLCRSPLAECLARRAVAQRLGSEAATFAVSSAGTHALAGDDMHPYAAHVLLESGIDIDGFRSRPLSVQMLARPHLVLTATRQQRAHCVTRSPASLRRTFTLRQFARLAGAVGPGCLGDLSPGLRAQTLVGLVLDLRGSMQPVNADEDDLADPVNLPLQGFRECARDINAAVEMMIDIIVPT